MLNTNCKKLDGILFTHEHADHTAGLDDKTFYFRQGNIDLYAHERVLDSLKTFDYIFETENKYPGAPSVNQHIIRENTMFKIGQKNNPN